jgi:hypothetical protein
MELSSPTSDKPLPEGVSDADLYEGPKIVPLASGKAAFVAQAVQPAAAAPSAEALVRPIPPPNLKVHGVPVELDPVPVTSAVIKSGYPELIGLALDVLATKVHALLALVAAVVIWGAVVFNPDPYRIAAAGAFSILVFLPMMVIYWRSGMKGETDA